MKKKSNRLKFLFLLLPVVVILVILLFRHDVLFTLPEELRETLDVFLHVGEVLGVLIALVLTIQELMASKEISRATFIVDLNKSYVENDEYMMIYDYLQDRIDNGAPAESSVDIRKGAISNYLTFFETIYILYQRGVISFAIIDDLFAYRFFLAVHSELFQEKKLLSQPKNFKNIFKLEREWLAYRVEKGKMKKEDLNAAPDRDPSNVYISRQLSVMLGDPELYSELIR